METVVVIGTRKGLWVATSRDGRRTWNVEGPHLAGQVVTSCAIDTRGDRPRLLAGASSWFYGPSVHRSDDLGASWDDSERAPLSFPEGTEAAVANVWQLAPDTADRPGVVWAGSEPSALWRSEDGGESFSLVRGLWDHPHRPEWQPGGGGQALHTILPHPTDDDLLSVVMSTGGLYRSTDGGASWDPSNEGFEGDYLPEDHPPHGFCVHRVARDAVEPTRLFAQHHGGVYRSDDDGGHWYAIDEGLPDDFGFPIATHPRDADTAYVYPLDHVQRTPPGGRAAVYRTGDGGKTWEGATAGLPDEPFHAAVLRDAMCTDDADPAGLYLGTRNGTVFASADEGESFTTVVQYLPDVLTVRAATIG
jgi:photosystem II stability/assembly factor-like uncharacterized protein